MSVGPLVMAPVCWHYTWPTSPTGRPKARKAVTWPLITQASGAGGRAVSGSTTVLFLTAPLGTQRVVLGPTRSITLWASHMCKKLLGSQICNVVCIQTYRYVVLMSPQSTLPGVTYRININLTEEWTQTSILAERVKSHTVVAAETVEGEKKPAFPQ